MGLPVKAELPGTPGNESVTIEAADWDKLEQAQQLNSRTSWRPISETRWRKEIEGPFGTLLCEVLRSSGSNGYLARVTVKRADSSSADENEVLESSEVQALNEAQLVCEELAAIASNGPLSWSLSMPLEPSSDEING
jgi:hypothetical protein